MAAAGQTLRRSGLVHLARANGDDRAPSGQQRGRGGGPMAPIRPIALLAMGAGLTRTHADPDLWGHLRGGLDILRDKAIPLTDPYSYTSDRTWINHGWLPEPVAAAFYALAGSTGLVVMKVLIGVALFGLVWGAVRHRQFVWRWSAMAIAAFAALPILITIRPQLWTMLGMVIVCRTLASSSLMVVWVLPPLFALWANMHGGWMVGGGVVVMWTAIALGRRERRAWPLLAAGACSFAATLLTPYGVDLWRFLAETVRFERSDISEWQPIWRLGLDSVLLWTAVVAFIGVSRGRAERPSLEVTLVLTALAVASTRVDRLVPLFGLAAVTLLARTWPEAQRPESRMPGRALVDACAVSAGLIALLIGTHGSPACLTIDAGRGPDTTAAESLRGRTGRVVTFFDWGEYAIWHFGPDLRVSSDGRRETVYSQNVLRLQREVLNGTASGVAELMRTRPEYVWLPNTAARTRNWLLQNGYREDVRTDRSYVAVREDLAPLSPWSGVSTRCFPGP